MTFDEMKASHERQIKALLTKDRKELLEIYGGRAFFDEAVDDEITYHHAAWDLSGYQSDSLFARLPDVGCCLTELKKAALRGDDDVIQAAEFLGVVNNSLIPAQVDYEVEFTEAQLREFSRLQLLARFGRSE